MPPRIVSAALLAVLALSMTAMAARDAASQPGRSRVVAIADIHGSLSGLTTILREAGLIDDHNRWSGGAARLVQMGDFLDRGAEMRQVMDLLMRLEGEARRVGGRVDVLFGNHEGMNLIHDLRDVPPAAYAPFADRRSEDRRRRAFEAHAAAAKRSGRTIEPQAWMSARPLGFVEYVEAISPSGRYGRWLRSRPAMLRIDDTIFMHAGLAPESTATVDEVNRTIEREVRTWDAIMTTLVRARLVTRTFMIDEIVQVTQDEIERLLAATKGEAVLGEHVTREYALNLQQIASLNTWALVAAEGPLWYRGLATSDDGPGFERLLARLGGVRFVVGHTPQLPGRITPRFDGRVILADTGMLTTFYRGGRPSAVEIADGRLTAIYPGSREALPSPAATGSPVPRP
jgi:hypothetical protein